jgi:hypothetical protein
MTARLLAAGEQLRHPAPGSASAVVLHVDDHAVAHAQDLAPLEPLALGAQPGERDRDLAVVLANVIHAETVVARTLAPLDL